KRKDLSLEITGATALLSAKDFSVEISYALTDGNPDTYDIVESMRELLSAELAQTEAFARIFTGRFTEMSFALRKGAKVEAVIDAIESLDPAQGLRVEYQSDCSECTISVNEVDAVVRCTGGSLDMVFPRAGSPRELIAAFAAVRSSFAVSRVLAGLIER
ncbi:MAG: hypothetical protein Q8M02_11225, partial [Candidatus Didemnitutus sp.]|nr:hypothetical protein [Candidatus Didemnitutus sp.]